MRTPGHDRELAAGFLLTEGVIQSARDLADLVGCSVEPPAQAMEAILTRSGTFDPTQLSRHTFTSASCGLCAQTTIDAVLRQRRPLRDPIRIPVSLLLQLSSRLEAAQPTFRTTGGLHACGLFDQHGQLLVAREDVGRHNALDKLIGWAVLQKRTPLRGHLLLLSGRTSFEMVQKAHAAGIPVVASISAPSSLAVEFARAAGLTLAGFVRERSLNLYAGAERIGPPERKRAAR